MTTTLSEIDSLSLTVNQEIRVNASLEVTFAALLEQLGPGNEMSNGTPMPIETRGVARRTVVPRSWRGQRPLLGHSPGDQASHTA